MILFLQALKVVVMMLLLQVLLHNVKLSVVLLILSMVDVLNRLMVMNLQEHVHIMV